MVGDQFNRKEFGSFCGVCRKLVSDVSRKIFEENQEYFEAEEEFLVVRDGILFGCFVRLLSGSFAWFTAR